MSHVDVNDRGAVKRGLRGGREEERRKWGTSMKRIDLEAGGVYTSMIIFARSLGSSRI